MRYAVKVLQDDELPVEHNWCIIRTPETVIACVKGSVASSPQVLADAWAAAREIRAHLLRSA